MYTFDQTYSALFGYNHIYGNSDSQLYTSNNNTVNRPNTEYFTFELDYMPFGKTAGSGASSYMNIKFAAQYVAYTLFNGAVKNYDSTTGRNASDNNTLYFNGWLTF